MNDITLSSSITMKSKEIADLTGKRHDHVLRDIDNLLKTLSPELGAGFSMTYEGDPSNGYRVYLLDRDSSICLVSGYDANARMKIIKRWQALETGEATPAFKIKPKRERVSSQLSAKMMIARQVRTALRMSDTSYIGMVSKIAESEGIAPAFLPAYVNESLTKALTALLKDRESALSARAANLALVEMGILETLERTGSKGDTKSFKSLTDAGLKYGRNETSPQNPRETQPLYFVSAFGDLIARIEAHIEARPAPVKMALVKADRQALDGGAV